MNNQRDLTPHLLTIYKFKYTRSFIILSFFFIECDGGDFLKQIEVWIYVMVGCKSSQSSQMDHWPTFEVLV